MTTAALIGWYLLAPPWIAAQASAIPTGQVKAWWAALLSLVLLTVPLCWLGLGWVSDAASVVVLLAGVLAWPMAVWQVRRNRRTVVETVVDAEVVDIERHWRYLDDLERSLRDDWEARREHAR